MTQLFQLFSNHRTRICLLIRSQVASQTDLSTLQRPTKPKDMHRVLSLATHLLRHWTCRLSCFLGMNISEPSIVAYARLHGLTRPPSPGNPQIFKDAEIIKPPGGFDFPDDEAILQGLAGSSSSPERPSLDETDRDFLASIVALRIGRAKTPDQKSLFAGGQRRVDSPLLYTDHELDVIIHCKACDATLTWVAEPIASDCEKDEALDWPSWSFNTPTTYEHACRAEKLRIRQEAFMLLESAIYGPSVAHCEDECLYAFNKVRPITTTKVGC